MRRLPMLLASALLSATPALAGDMAQIDILGFTADGGIFAFEEYGVQDGSGFPYAHRFYIDTSTDRFVSGSPVRVRLEDENASLQAARAEARRKGERIVRDRELDPGFAAGVNAIGEMNADAVRMVVNPRPVFPMIDEPLEFRLDPIPMPQIVRCAGFGEVYGFRALRIRARDGAPTETLHEDRDKIPLSRGCPTGYGVVAVQTAYPDAGEPVFALVVSVARTGFEGPDHRYLAITGRIGP